MKTLRQIIIAIIVICAIGFALVPSKVNAQTLPPITPLPISDELMIAAGLHGYVSRQKIVDKFDSISEEEFPYWKKMVLFNKLSEDGYFWMKTCQEKKQYIWANLANNKHLLDVADAENIHSTTCKDTKNDSANYRDEEKKSWAFEKRVEDNQKLWYNTLMPVFKNKPKQITYRQAYFDKRYWPSDARNSLYLYFWPDLKDKNLNATKFTPDEERRLQDAYNISPSGDIDNQRDLGAAGVIAHMPADNGIIKDWNFYARNAAGGDGQGWTFEWYVNGEMRWKINLSGADCVGLAAGGGPAETAVEGAFWIWAKAAGIRLTRPIANVGESVATRLMSTGMQKTSKKLAQVMEMSVKEFAQYSSRKVRVDLSYTLRNASVNQYARKKIAESIEQSVNLVAYNLRVNGLANLADTFVTRWNNKLLKAQIVNSDTMAVLSGSRGCLGLCNYENDFIYINENVFLIQGRTKATTTHEFIHAASAVTQDYLESHRVGYPGGGTTCPLVEGLTETITRLQTGEKIPINNPLFAAFTQVGDEYYSMLIRRKGSNEGTKLLYQLYFRDGLVHADEALEIPGFDQQLNSYINSWDIDGAIQYLRSL